MTRRRRSSFFLTRATQAAATARWSALVIAAVVLGCASGEDARARRAAQADGSADTLTYTMHAVRRAKGDCRRPGEDTTALPCVSVALSYPIVDSAPVAAVADSVRAFVRRMAFTQFYDSIPAPDGDSAAASFVAAYDAAYREMPERWQLWSREEHVSVACNTPDVVGLRAEGNQYTGGAHPIGLVFLASYDAHTGERLRPETLFAADSLPAVAAAAERAFRRERDIPPEQSLADAGFIFFENDRFHLPDQMLVCPDSVTFHFNPYDVGPYVLGPTTFSLAREEVEAFLRAGRG